VVREVGPLVSEGGSTNSDGLLSSSRGVIACIAVIVTWHVYETMHTTVCFKTLKLTSSNGEMESTIDSTVNGVIEGLGLSTTQTHVCNRALVVGPSGSSILLSSSISFNLSLFSRPSNTPNDIGHASTSIGTQYLDSDDVSLLSNTIFFGSDGSSTVSTMTVAVLIFVISRHSCTPGSATLELDVGSVDTSIDDIYVYTSTTLRFIQVLSESTEREFRTVTDAGQTLNKAESECYVYPHVTRLGITE